MWVADVLDHVFSGTSCWYASKKNRQLLVAQGWLMILCCPHLKTWLSIRIHGLQGIDGTWGTVLLHCLAGWLLVQLQWEQSQACSKYNRQQGVRVYRESGVILSLCWFSDVPVIALKKKIHKNWFVTCKKIKGKQGGMNNIPATKVLAEFTCGVSSGGSFPSSLVTLHRLSSVFESFTSYWGRLPLFTHAYAAGK